MRTRTQRSVQMLVRAGGRGLFRIAVVVTVVLFAAAVQAQDAVSLMAPADAWSFGDGPEFPGATGSLAVDADATRDGRESLKLVGDFTKGGGYVQAGRAIDSVDLRELSLWVRSANTERLTVRINDTSGQTHQIVLRLEPGPDWQRVVLPLERFFASRGQADAVTTVTKYESWGGAKDGQWHGPATAIYFLVSNHGFNAVRMLWLNDITLLPRPSEVPGAELKSSLRLDEIVEGVHDWRFSHGAEFPGAKGSLTTVPDEPAAGQSCLKLSGDFTSGGAYVAAIRNLTALGTKDVLAFRLRVKSDNAASVGIQIVDSTGQTHQRRDTPIKSDGQWHDLVLIPSEIAGGEHWGGANDAQWHASARQLVISLTQRSDPRIKQPTLRLADVRADALLPVFVQPAAFKADFETAPLDKTWTITEDAAIDARTAFKGERSLVLARSLEHVEQPRSIIGPTFAAADGRTSRLDHADGHSQRRLS